MEDYKVYNASAKFCILKKKKKERREEMRKREENPFHNSFNFKGRRKNKLGGKFIIILGQHILQAAFEISRFEHPKSTLNLLLQRVAKKPRILHNLPHWHSHRLHQELQLWSQYLFYAVP